MKWSGYIAVILGLSLLAGCTKKYFDQNLLSDREDTDEIQKNPAIKCYDTPDQYFYLVTFYLKTEKNVGEDFSYESVNTYKNSLSDDNSIQKNSTIVQYLALYFFRDGGVVYHTKYSVLKGEEYVPLKLSALTDLYKMDAVTKKQNRADYVIYRPLMQGYQLNKVDVSKVVNLANRADTSKISKRTERYDLKAMQYDQAIKGGMVPDSIAGSSGAETLVKLYLERRGGESSILMVGKHLPLNKNHRESILIEQLFFEKEINSSSEKYTSALLDKTFDLGTVTDTTKALLWFRLQKKGEFRDKQPLNSRR